MKEKLVYSLNDIVGYDAEKERINRIIHDINNFDVLKKQGIYLPKGLIISGPPGVGKTQIAKIISSQCKVNFFICDLSYSGRAASQQLLDIFKKANKKKPAVIYIDELDKYLPSNNSESSSVYQKETLSTLLTILDGFSETDGIMFLATTSSKDDLPSEVLRAGRIDEHICLSLPTREEREKIFSFYLKKLSLDYSSINMDTLLSKTSSFSGADLKSLINKTAAKVQYLNRNSLVDEDFFDSINEIRFQDIKKRKNKGSEKITAYHELGHYVAAKYLLGVSCDISIENYDDDLGATILQDKVKFNEDDEGIDVRKRSSLLKLVTICLSGRAAEEVFIGQPCVGCEADYKQAILMLSNMCEEGMFGEEYVNLNFLNSSYESSNETRDFILKMLKAQHVLATKIIDENKKFIKVALPKLMDKGFLSGEEMDKINLYHPITHEVEPNLHVLNKEQED